MVGLQDYTCFTLIVLSRPLEAMSITGIGTDGAAAHFNHRVPSAVPIGFSVGVSYAARGNNGVRVGLSGDF
jgi:hypothetical protein